MDATTYSFTAFFSTLPKPGVVFCVSPHGRSPARATQHAVDVAIPLMRPRKFESLCPEDVSGAAAISIAMSPFRLLLFVLSYRFCLGAKIREYLARL